MNAINFQNKLWYFANELREKHPTIFAQIKKKESSRKIIEIIKIPQTDFIFIFKNKIGIFIESNFKNSRAKLLISCDFVEKLLSTKIKELPILTLEPSQKFQANGKIFEIETRGELHVDKIYFSADDISIIFDIPQLVHYIQNNKASAYVENEDFIYLNTMNNNNNNNSKKQHKSSGMFLTYFGVVRCIFNSKSMAARSFQQWAIKQLFTIQCGSQEDKKSLASSLIGVPIDTMRYALSTSHSTTPCIYLYEIGDFFKTIAEKNIQTNLQNINNNNTTKNLRVFKYGFTKSLNERMYRHQLNFKKMGFNKMGLYKYQLVDPAFLSEAETFIKYKFVDLCGAKKIKFNSQNEIIGIEFETNEKKNKKIEKCFNLLQTKFSGKLKDIIQRQKEDKLKMDNKFLKHLAGHVCKKRTITEDLSQFDEENFLNDIDDFKGEEPPKKKQRKN